MKPKSKGWRIWKWIKRIFLALFVLQLVYIILLKWIDPPLTLTQIGSLFGGGRPETGLRGGGGYFL